MSDLCDGPQSRKPTKLPALSSRSLPLDSRLSMSTCRSPLFYNWESSLPQNWAKMSPRPLKRIPGVVGSRSTLDFLRETHRYITQITERKFRNKKEPRYPVSRLKPTLFHLETLGGSDFWRTNEGEAKQLSYRMKIKATVKREKKEKKAEYQLVGV